jgi:hypothetical protein
VQLLAATLVEWTAFSAAIAGPIVGIVGVAAGVITARGSGRTARNSPPRSVSTIEISQRRQDKESAPHG